ncbi:DUF6111 family protein [Maricaulis sp.]|jgi:hypothetical protein|uniref:DUF6111 family protein n=1 Tax=Maricaulis sp. TaxID=1486257 RepID=UPI0026398CD7|nr:DUF6111 family protein [Maricaulis sp.]
MIRITLIEIASFLLPFALFFIWRWQTQADVKLTATPALRLGLAGAALAIAMMIVLVVLDAMRGGHEGDQYVPPRMVDGEIVPGHFVPPSERDEPADAGEEDDDPQ